MFKNISYKGDLTETFPSGTLLEEDEEGKHWKVLDADYDEESDRTTLRLESP